MASETMTLMSDSSDSEPEFTINKNYADRYDSWRNKEEMQKLKDLSRDLSETSSESEEEDTPEIEEDFLKTLNLLKSRDPKIYDERTTFFSEEVETKDKPKAKKDKPLFMKDYERKAVLERNGQFSDDEEFIPTKGPTAREEQEEIKKSFKAALEEDEGEGDDLFQVRAKTKKEEELEESDYLQWLKGQKDDVAEDTKKNMSYLRKCWNDPELDQGEKFLRDYILNQKFLDQDKGDKIPSYEEITRLSDDEKLMDQQEEFEHKYNFRFEEPDTEFIKRYPRTIGDSLRREDNRRKSKRDDYAERKKKEKEQKREELKRLKALKRKEIEEKFQKLKEITGQEELNFDEADMESDFDPDKHDQKMKEMFNDDYYSVEEQQKPEFIYDEELDTENWDRWTREQEATSSKQDDEDQEHDDDTSDDEACKNDPKLDFEKEMIESTHTGRKKSRKKSHFAKIISEPKPIYDADGKSFEDYLDEYYKLDYEDLVGNQPVRFKYRKVVPNDFGLTVNEILSAHDKDLNRWCSVKKTCQYRREEEELYDVQAFRKKAENPLIKQKILSSVYSEPRDNMPQQVDADGSVNEEKKKRRGKKKKAKDVQTAENESGGLTLKTTSNIELFEDEIKEPDELLKEDGTLDTEETTKTTKKRKRNNKKTVDQSQAESGGFQSYNIENTFSTEIPFGNMSTETGARNENKKTKIMKPYEMSAIPNESRIRTWYRADEVRSNPDVVAKQDTFVTSVGVGIESAFESTESTLSSKRQKRSTKEPFIYSTEKDTSTKSKVEMDSIPSTNDSDSDTTNLRSVEQKSTIHVSDRANTSKSTMPKKKRKKKKKKSTNSQDIMKKKMTVNQHFNQTNRKTTETDKRLNLTNERLAAYGINPKKFKNSIKFSKNITK